MTSRYTLLLELNDDSSRRLAAFPLSLVTIAGIAAGASLRSPTNAANANPGADLQMVVMLSRDDMPSPIGSLDLYNKYSTAPWPCPGCVPGLSHRRVATNS